MDILVDFLVTMCPGADIDKLPVAEPVSIMSSLTNSSTSAKRSELFQFKIAMYICMISYPAKISPCNPHTLES